MSAECLGPTPSTRRRNPVAAPDARLANAPVPAHRRLAHRSAADRRAIVEAFSFPKAVAPTGPNRFVPSPSTRPGTRPPVDAILARSAPTRPRPNRCAVFHPNAAHNAAETSAIPRSSMSSRMPEPSTLDKLSPRRISTTSSFGQESTEIIGLTFRPATKLATMNAEQRNLG